MIFLLLQVAAGLAAVCTGFPSYPEQRFYYELPTSRHQYMWPHHQLLAQPLVYHQPIPSYLSGVASFRDSLQKGYVEEAVQEGKPIYMVSKDEAAPSAYSDNVVGITQVGESGIVGVEEKPEAVVAPVEIPVLAKKPEEVRRKYVMKPAIKAPHATPAYLMPVVSRDGVMQQLEQGVIQNVPGSAAFNFQKMLSAARLKAAQANMAAVNAEQEAAAVHAEEENKEEEHQEEQSSEEDSSQQQENYGPSIAQAKPQAISVAGPGGVAAAAPIGTAVVGPGGMALSAPHATAVAGAPRKPQPQEDKARLATSRTIPSRVPPASYFLRY